MFAQYYERKRKTGLDSKPTLEKIFALKTRVAAEGKAIKVLYLTDDEVENLGDELTKLKDEIKNYKPNSDIQDLAKILGVPLEVLNEVGVEKVA